MDRTRPSSRRTGLAALIVAGLTLGILPPALGRGGPPETVIRTHPVPARAMLGGPGDLRAVGGTLSTRSGAWTHERTICPDITFTALGIRWQQDGDAGVVASIRWGDEDEMSPRSLQIADPDHGPDPGSPDAENAGTDAVWTGEARCAAFSLQVEPGTRISDVRVTFLNTSGTASSHTFLGSLGAAISGAMRSLWGLGAPDEAAALARRPGIITRSGWGADESKRNCGPDYADELKMAYVHHTAGSNTYSKGQADDVVRSVYAYHTDGRGWCDIAYNFLVDRFGRIYEGRYGGMTEPVIGGHAMGFNTGSAGVAVMGDFTHRSVPSAVMRGLKKLLAWRLDVAHLNPKGTATMVSGGGSNQKYDEGEEVRLPVISGHRQTGYTTCPGDRLWAKLPALRRGVYKRGLPKIWDVSASTDRIQIGETRSRIKATISAPHAWRVTAEHATEGVQRTWQGSGDRINILWKGLDPDGFPVDDGTYDVTIETREVNARPAVLEIRVSGGCTQSAGPGGGPLVGTSGDDVLCGGEGADIISGLEGNDVLLGLDGNDTLRGGPGHDTLIGGRGHDTLEGEGGEDSLSGLNGNDTLLGGANDDTLDGGAGSDTLDGDGGSGDTATFAKATRPISADLAAGTASGAGSDILISIENLTGGPKDDHLRGNAGPNVLRGGGGNDTLLGLGGDDRLEGRKGNDALDGGPSDDTMIGGGGRDRALFGSSPAGVTIDLAKGTATGYGNDTLKGIFHVTGSPFADVLRGDARGNTLEGGPGNDTIIGRGGHDLLKGGRGRDDLRGGAGRDDLRAKDGARDDLDGGGGEDSATYDRRKDRLSRIENR